MSSAKSISGWSGGCDRFSLDHISVCGRLDLQRVRFLRMIVAMAPECGRQQVGQSKRPKPVVVVGELAHLRNIARFARRH